MISAAGILKEHKATLLGAASDNEFRLTVQCQHPFHDSVKGMRHLNDSSKHFKVIFVGEPGVDEGGPRCEFFHLFLAELGNQGTLFTGPPEKRVLLHNTMALERGDFLAAGKLIGLSLIHGGPGPHVFAPSTAKYLLGMDAKDLNVDPDEVADLGTLELVKKVCMLS